MILKVKNASSITRRSALIGGVSLGVIAGLTSVGQAGLFNDRISLRKNGSLRKGEGDLGKYLCSKVHDELAMELDEIILNPAIDGEQTAKALMEAHCPGCRQRIAPKNSAISAVIPKWSPTVEA